MKVAFKVGDDVLLHITRKKTRTGGKLDASWMGAFKEESPPEGRIQIIQRQTVVNGRRLKTYNWPDDEINASSSRKRKTTGDHEKNIPPKKRPSVK